MCDWLIAVSPCLGEKERGVKVRLGKITKPGKRSPASHSSQLLLIGQSVWRPSQFISLKSYKVQLI